MPESTWKPGEKFMALVMTPDCQVIEEEVTCSWLFGWCYTSQYDFPVPGGDLWCTCPSVMYDMAAVRKKGGYQQKMIDHSRRQYEAFEQRRETLNNGGT